jgi:hypothetical protein
MIRFKQVTWYSQLLAVVLFVGVFALGFYLGQIKRESIVETSVIQGCTKELKICPDGTGVGRTGPNCAFAPCP